MRHWMIRAMVVSGCFIGTLAAPDTAEAQVLDWLFPRRACRRACRQACSANSCPTTAYRVAYTAPSSCSTCVTPTTVAYAPSACTSCAGSGCSVCAPVQTGWVYRPNVQYRTVWAQVPVTTYRPVSGNCMQSCGSYTWQARRVPYVTYRPMFAGCTTSAPVTGNYWTQFGSAGYSLPRRRASAPVAACPTCPSGGATAADAAPSLVSPTVTTNYPATTSYSSGWQPVDSCSGCNGTTSTTVTAGYGATDWQPVSESSTVNTNNDMPATSPATDYAGATEWKPVESESAAPAQNNRDLAPVPANRPPSLQENNNGSGMQNYNRYGQQQYQPHQQQRDTFSSGVRPSKLNRPVVPRPSWSTSQSGVQPSRPATQPAIPDWDRNNEWRRDLQQQLDSLSDSTASLERKPVATRWQAIPVRQASNNRTDSAPSGASPAARDGWRSAL